MNIGREQAAREQRGQIPVVWQVEFETWGNQALASLCSDAAVNNQQIQAYARWELNFRETFGILVDYGPDGNLRRLENDDEYEAALAADNRHEKIDRTQFSEAAVREQITDRMK